MRQYRIIAPGFVILHLMVTRSSGCLATIHGKDISLSRKQSADMLRIARAKQYQIARTLAA